MPPTMFGRPLGLVFRDRVAAKLLQQGVPAKLTIPIIDSMETIAYASAVASERITIETAATKHNTRRPMVTAGHPRTT